MSRDDSASMTRHVGWVHWILLAMVVLRGAALIRFADSFSDDPDAYRRIAWTLDQTGTFGLKFGDGEAKPTAYRPPLYPWLLSWFVTDADDAESSLPAIRIGLLHLLAFVVTLGAVFRTGIRLLDRRAAMVACLMVTLDPLLIRQSTLVMTETIAVMLTSLAMWSFVVMVQATNTTGNRKALSRLATWGLAITLAVDFLCRPTFLVWAGLLAMVCFWKPGFRRPALTVTLMMAATVGLWTMRNVRAVGQPVWATTHGGYTILLPNNRFFYDYLREGWSWTAWDAGPFTQAYIDRHAQGGSEQGGSEQGGSEQPASGQPASWQGGSGQPASGQGERLRKTWDIQASVPSVRDEDGEMANDRWAGNIAKATIRENPGLFLWSSFVRVLRLWSPIPLWTSERSTTSILIVGLFYVAIYIAVAFAIMKHGRRLFQFSWLPVWTLAIALTMVHSIYWTNLRMRCPVQPGIALLAAAAIVRRNPSGTDL